MSALRRASGAESRQSVWRHEQLVLGSWLEKSSGRASMLVRVMTAEASRVAPLPPAIRIVVSQVSGTYFACGVKRLREYGSEHLTRPAGINRKLQVLVGEGSKV